MTEPPQCLTGTPRSRRPFAWIESYEGRLSSGCMPPEMTPEELRAVRMVANGLAGDRAGDAVAAVRRVVGVQAQDARATRMQVRARTVGVTGVRVDQEVAKGRLVATWAMRGTLHLLPEEDVRWAVGLLGPRFAARSAGRRKQLGLDEATSAKALAAVGDVLSTSGPLVRADLVAAVADHGVRLDAKSQAPAHLVSYAAMCGLVCRGPAADGEPTYVLLDDWLPADRPLSEEDALTRLAERYLTGFGPATAADFAAWSGLPLGACRRGFRGLQDHITPVTAAPEPSYVLRKGLEDTHAGLGDTDRVRLLGHFDTYLLGYRSRDLVLAEEFAKRIQAGGGFVMPAVLVDGRVAGTWAQRTKSSRIEVSVEPFRALDRGWLPGLEAEAADIGRFVGAEAELIVKPPGK